MTQSSTVEQGLTHAAARLRREFGVGAGDGGLESVPNPQAPQFQNPKDRITQAREAMLRIVVDRFGGDAALADAVDSIALSADEAVAVLAEVETIPSVDQVEALEAVVVFDGTRPSFLVANDAIDFGSSFNTGPWKATLRPFADQLAAHAACVGRVERDGDHVGTAFLVTPTLAITNRHVAQLMASFSDGVITLAGVCSVDFGRERVASGGHESFDRRTVTEIAFAGAATITGQPIDHALLDLAVLRISESKLSGAARDRHLAIGGVTARGLVDDSRFLAVLGYPGDPDLVLSPQLMTQFGNVIRKLLEGDGGEKRFAPGQFMSSPRIGLSEWTATYDSTTIGGNSGSPLLVFPLSDPPVPRAAGLHYGGRSLGDRVNWAHLLHYGGAKSGYGQQATFAEFCQKEGISAAMGSTDTSG